MREILGKAKTVPELLKGVKYSIDYHQRKYKWHDNQIREAVEDLMGTFVEKHDPSHARKKVADYHRLAARIWNADDLLRERGA